MTCQKSFLYLSPRIFSQLNQIYNILWFKRMVKIWVHTQSREYVKELRDIKNNGFFQIKTENLYVRYLNSDIMVHGISLFHHINCIAFVGWDAVVSFGILCLFFLFIRHFQSCIVLYHFRFQFNFEWMFFLVTGPAFVRWIFWLGVIHLIAFAD